MLGSSSLLPNFGFPICKNGQQDAILEGLMQALRARGGGKELDKGVASGQIPGEGGSGVEIAPESPPPRWKAGLLCHVLVSHWEEA